MSRRQLLKSAAVIGAVASAGAVTGSTVAGATQPQYTFNDDFIGPAGSAPNPAYWSYDIGGGGWGNNELETYTSSRANSYLDGNSNLVIQAVKTTIRSRGRTRTAYTSARLKTLGKFSQLGGHFQARIKLNSQRGLWPAFWMMGSDITSVNWPQCGEVDILEDYGYSAMESSVHAPDGNGSVYTADGGLPSDTAWHVYQMDWDATGFMFSRDGSPYMSVPPSFCPAKDWVFGPGTPNNGGMFFLLNLAVGGNVGTPPASTRFPVQMLVDYVRVWK